MKTINRIMRCKLCGWDIFTGRVINLLHIGCVCEMCIKKIDTSELIEISVSKSL